MRLGIDFGTTRTVVAAAIDGRYPLAVFETPHGFVDYLPGLSSFDGASWTHGWEAAGLLPRQSNGVIRSIKRVVGQLAPEDPVPGLAEEGVSALSLMTRYLEFVRESLLEGSNLDLDGEPLEAVVAVPANASTRQRYLTLDAFSRAGFEVLGMINEPTAAGIEYAQRNLGALARRSPKRYVVVYDLGGGTFDTSAISLSGRRYELLTSEGIARLGGDDFDEIILELALAELGGKPTELGPGQRAALLERCREAKEAIALSSRKLLLELPESLGGDSLTLELSAVYDRAQPLVDKTIALVQRVFARLEAHGLDPASARELGAIYLVGGATAFPPVQRTLKHLFKRKIQLAPQPHASTAIGLAIAADPNSATFVHEAVTRHFGVWREGSEGREKVYDPIFAKGSLGEGDLALVAEREYRPAHAVGHLRLVECSELNGDGQPAGDLTPWGELFFPYDPALSAHRDLPRFAGMRRPDLQDQAIRERYEYERDGTVRVHIENRTRGYARSYRFRVDDFHERGDRR